jgi:regulation of enolase protein 1 (concanavalin A-like superfamily)
LSSVLLTFNDGSEARLGPNTEVSIEKLNAHPSDGPRIVVLSQWIGETDHQVASVTGYNSRYEVHTPSAVGTARGTAFQVRVTHDRLTRITVDEGTVAVEGRNRRVDVMARQATLVGADGALEDPSFRITGEGEVTQTGPTWIIAGLAFETHDETVIIGNPQVGDWVYVDGRLLTDGTRVADWLLLLRRSPANRFTITGRVEAMEEDEWTIAGQAIQVDEETDIDEEIALQDQVRVKGIILQDGVLLAEEIRLIEETPGLPFSFTGVVQEVISDTWKISGVVITVDDETQVDEGIETGDVVDVRGWILEDGNWLARAIQRAEDVERSFEFTGEVERVDPWQVAGIPFETRTWTEIDSGIEAGDLVRVKGRILEDGTWVASTIERLDDDEQDDELQIVFVGPVDGIDPWLVSGIPLTIDDDTLIDEDISVGDLVRVMVRILSDGSWLATSIERLELDGGGLGCVHITAVVKEVGPGWVLPENWSIIDLDGVSVEGEIQVGSVILMLVCVAEDGSIDVVSIVVIYQPPAATPPTPTPASGPPAPLPPPPPPGHGEDDKVTICHRPPGNPDAAHTITISRSALQEHLSHGDTLGPCP